MALKNETVRPKKPFPSAEQPLKSMKNSAKPASKQTLIGRSLKVEV